MTTDSSDRTKIPAPVDTSNDGLAIHLSYIRRDIDEIKANQTKNSAEVRLAFENLSNGYVSRADFNEHMKGDEDHEARIRALERNMWRISGATGIIAGGISLLGSFILQHLIH